MSFQSTDFIFGGISSKDIGVKIIRLENDDVVTPITASATIKTERIPYRDVSYFYRKEYDKGIEISFKIIPEDYDITGVWTSELKAEVLKWLNTREVKMFQSYDDLTKYLPCIQVNTIDFSVIGANGGYIELKFESTLPYWVSSLYYKEFDLSDASVNNPRYFRDYNLSNVPEPKTGLYIVEPEKIVIEIADNSTSFELINTSDGGRVFGFENLQAGEIITIENRRITSSLGLNRIKNLINKQHFRLIEGSNIFMTTTPAILKYWIRYPLAY